MVKPQLPITAGGDAERGRGRGERVPGELRVVVGVVVDDAGHQRQAAGVDGFAVLLSGLACFKDFSTGNSKIASLRRATKAVEEKRVSNDEIVHAPNTTAAQDSAPRPGVLLRRRLERGTWKDEG
jgi:hypothetical protein